MKKTIILIMVVTVISKIFGLTRDIVLSYFYGASTISDAYLVSTTISAVLFGFIIAGISTGYIPLYKTIEKNHGTEQVMKFTNNLLNFLLLLTSLMVILGLIFTEHIVGVFASGFEGEAFVKTVYFTKISLFSIYTITLSYLFSAFLQLRDNYLAPALIGIPLNVITVLSIYISSKTNTTVLIVGALIATASQILFLMPFVYKKGYRYQFILDYKDKHIISLAKNAIPIIIGVSINEINVLVDRTIASNIAVGGISALNYANMLNGFVQGIFVVSIATVMYPRLSDMAANRDMDGFKKMLSNAIGSINLFVLPITLGAMFFATPVITLLFGRGAFDSNAIEMTSTALFYFSLCMLGFGQREMLSRAFYSLQDTRTPMINAAIAVILNIILNIILSKFLGIGGLALATSISSVFCSLLLMISLRKKIGAFGLKKILISFLKMLTASFVMVIIVYLLFIYLINIIGSNFALIICIILGAVIYLGLIYFMKIEEVDVILNTVKSKLRMH
jgi:putative peptidoglycan lipid II flippase